jgi:hypothetical protein
MKFFVILFGLCVLTLGLGQAALADTTYTLSGVTFNDGGIVSGTFTVDASEAITSWDILTTAGTIANSNNYGALPATTYVGAAANPAVAAISPLTPTILDVIFTIPSGPPCPGIDGGGGLGACSGAGLNFWISGSSLPTTGPISLIPGMDCPAGMTTPGDCSSYGGGSAEVYLGIPSIGTSGFNCPGPSGGNYTGACLPYRLITAGELTTGTGGGGGGNNGVPEPSTLLLSALGFAAFALKRSWG